MQDYAVELGLHVELLPKFSCRINPIEHLWSRVKAKWGKKLACTHHSLPKNAIDDCVRQVVDEVAAVLTSKIMRSSDKAYAEVAAGKLV